MAPAHARQFTSIRRILGGRRSSRNRPGPGGSPHFEMTVTAEVPQNLDLDELREALEEEADRLVIDVTLRAAEGP